MSESLCTSVCVCVFGSLPAPREAGVDSLPALERPRRGRDGDTFSVPFRGAMPACYTESKRPKNLTPLSVRGALSKNLLGGTQRGHRPDGFDNSVPGAAFDQMLHSFSSHSSFRCRTHTDTVKIYTFHLSSETSEALRPVLRPPRAYVSGRQASRPG